MSRGRSILTAPIGAVRCEEKGKTGVFPFQGESDTPEY